MLFLIIFIPLLIVLLLLVLKYAVEDIVFISVILMIFLIPKILKYIFTEDNSKPTKKIEKPVNKSIEKPVTKPVKKFIPSSQNLSLKFTEQDIFNIEPRDFEIFMANIFFDNGYSVKITPYSNDGGKDIIVKKDEITYYVECKHWNNAVGRPELQKLVGAGIGNSVTDLLFISTGGFNKNAMKFAKDVNSTENVHLHLWSMSDILYFVNKNAKFEKTYDLNKFSEYNDLGIYYIDLQNYKYAIYYLNKAIKLRPNYNVYKYRGICYQELRNYEQAIQDYTASIELNSYNAEAYNNRAKIYFLMKNYQQALEDANEAIKIDDNNAEFYRTRAKIHKALEEFKN